MRGRVLAMLVCLGLFYGLVIMQLDERRERVEQSGTAAREAKLEDLKNQLGAVKTLQKKLEQREREMSEKYGQLRYLPDTEAAPLDTLMECIIAAARQAGGDIRTVTPVEAVDTGLMSLQGLDCTMMLPGEPAFEVFLNSMRTKFCPLTNEHSITLTRTKTGVQLEARFTVLRLKKSSNKALSAAGKALETWQGIQRPRGSVSFDALLEPRPLPPPAVVPTRAPKAAPVASAKPRPPPTIAPVLASVPAPVAPPRPPPPKFNGKLIGLTQVGGKAVALVDMGGQQKVIEEGQDIDGCKLRTIEADRMILDCGGQKSVVYFVGEAEPEERPAAEAAPSGGPRRAGLGLRGKFVPTPPASRLPPPFDAMRRVFEVSAVEDQTTAGRAGLRPNDRILAIDQVPLHSTDQVLGLRARIEAGQSATIAVERGGSLIALPFTQVSP